MITQRIVTRYVTIESPPPRLPAAAAAEAETGLVSEGGSEGVSEGVLEGASEAGSDEGKLPASWVTTPAVAALAGHSLAAAAVAAAAAAPVAAAAAACSAVPDSLPPPRGISTRRHSPTRESMCGRDMWIPNSLTTTW